MAGYMHAIGWALQSGLVLGAVWAVVRVFLR